MQQFWENPKTAHLIFVLEMRTFDFRFEKHSIFIFTNINFPLNLIFTELSRPSVACLSREAGNLRLRTERR